MKKITIEFVRLEFKKEKYRLLTTEYINSKQKLEYICLRGHRGTITWNSWNRGYRCAECGGTKRKDITFIREEFEKEGYILLSTRYEGTKKSKLSYICPKGHKNSITWSKWQTGHRCSDCGGSKKKDMTFVRLGFKKEGYQLLTVEYINSDQKLNYICPKGHRGNITRGNWAAGHRCATCSNLVSKPEAEIYDFIKFYFPTARHNDRKLIRPKELDIVIPSKKIAIEYCGLYWHSEAQGKDKNYHLNKVNKAKEQGYRLITIFEDEYINHKEVVLDKLKYILGVSDITEVDMDKCTIKEIDTKTAKSFCRKYHVQKYTKSDMRLGIYLGSKLLAVTSFRKNQLNQFYTLPNYDIQVILSNLLNYFISNYHYNSIYAYADKRWYDDILYKTFGMKRVQDTKPIYQYVKKNNDNKIWDCGSIQFVRG